MTVTNRAVGNGKRHNGEDVQIVALLQDMNARFERIERKLERLEHVIDQAPGMAAMLADTADGWYRDAARTGIDIDERVRQGLALLEKLSEPTTVAALTTLLDKVNWLATTADQAPGMLAMMLDVVDELYSTLKRDGIDVEETVRRGLLGLREFITLLQSPQFEALLQSGVLDPQTLTVMGHAAHALASSREPTHPVGPLSLAGALFRKDVQQSLGFALTFAGQFGDRLASEQARRNGGGG